MGLYLGVDLGTQSLKVLVYDATTRQVVARASRPIPAPESPRPGAAEQNPADWWNAFDAALRSVLDDQAVQPSRVRAIGVSGQQHGMVALDAAGEVLRPAKLWCDLEASQQAMELSEKIGRNIPPGFTAPKLLWMKQNEPQLFSAMHRLCLPHDWLNLCLSGNWLTDHGDASGNGLYDSQLGQYDLNATTWLDSELADKLPPLQAYDNWHGTLLPELATQYGLPQDVRIAIGSGDNMMSALGAGAWQEGSLVASLGTSGTLFGSSRKPLTGDDCDLSPFRDATGGWLPLYCIQNCTTVTEEVSAGFGLSLEELTSLAGEIEPGQAPLFLPYLTGERSPNWPHASGVLHRIRPGDLQAGKVFRAAIEGVSFALFAGLKKMRALGFNGKELRVVGGGAHNLFWCQLLADLFDTRVVRPKEADSAAFGAALQACATDGDDFHSALDEHATTNKEAALEPDSGRGAIYRELAQESAELGQKLFASAQ